MALQISKTLSNGLVANYWRITDLHYDLTRNTLVISMDLYADQTAKQNGLDVVWHGPFIFTGLNTSELDTIFKNGANFVAGTYAYLKTQTQFLTALDI